MKNGITSTIKLTYKNSILKTPNRQARVEWCKFKKTTFGEAL